MKYLNFLSNKGFVNENYLLGSYTIELFMQNYLNEFCYLDQIEKDRTKDHLQLKGLGHSLGAAVVVNPKKSVFYKFCPKGLFFWEGIAYTHFWVDPVEKINFIFMTQMRDFYQSEVGRKTRYDLKTLVYSSLIEK